MKQEYDTDEIEYVFRNFRPPVNEVFKERLRKRVAEKATYTMVPEKGGKNMSGRLSGLKEIFENEELAKEVLSIEQPEDAQEWFNEHDVDITLEEVKELGSLISKISSGEISKDMLDKASSGEMTEDELENVAGGALTADDKMGISFLIAAVIIGGSMFVAPW